MCKIKNSIYKTYFEILIPVVFKFIFNTDKLIFLAELKSDSQ